MLSSIRPNNFIRSGFGLNRLPMVGQLMIVMALVLIPVSAGVQWLFARQSSEAMEELGRTLLESLVMDSLAILEMQDELVSSGKLSESQARDMARRLILGDALDKSRKASPRLRSVGYVNIFATSVKKDPGTFVMHRDLTGLPAWDLRIDGQAVFQRSFANIANDGRHYVEIFQEPGESVEPWLSYSRYYEPWDWLITATARERSFHELHVRDFLRDGILLFLLLLGSVFIVVLGYGAWHSRRLRYVADRFDIMNSISRKALSEQNARSVYRMLEILDTESGRDEIAHLTSEFRRRLGEQIEVQRKLFDKNQALESRNRILENFAYVASHNLRSPITNFFGLLDLLETENSPQAIAEYVPLIRRSATAMLDTVDDLNTYLRIHMESDLPRESIDLEDLIEKVKSLLTNDLIATNAVVRVEWQGWPWVTSYRPYIESILQNLLSNALRYRSPDREPVITITVRNDDTLWALEVADNGIGFDERRKNKVFQLYQSLHSHKDSHGVGLFLTKAQVEVLGGTIDATSEPGIGTVFTVQFRK